MQSYRQWEIQSTKTVHILVILYNILKIEQFRPHLSKRSLSNPICNKWLKHHMQIQCDTSQSTLRYKTPIINILTKNKKHNKTHNQQGWTNGSIHVKREGKLYGRETSTWLRNIQNTSTTQKLNYLWMINDDQFVIIWPNTCKRLTVYSLENIWINFCL